MTGGICSRQHRWMAKGITALAMVATMAITAYAQDGVVFITDDQTYGDCGCDAVPDYGCYEPACLDCNQLACDSCESCGPLTSFFAGRERFWFGVDYLGWQLSGTDLPPLVTASPTGTAIANAGVLGDSSTTILAGNSTVGDDWRNGYRLQAGFWLDDCRTVAITGEYFDVGSDNYFFQQGSDSSLIVTRPFYNSELDTNDAELVSLDTELDGTVTVRQSDDFRGAALLLQSCLRRSCDPCGNGVDLDVIGGYRYYQYNSQLAINEDLEVLAGTTSPLIPGTTILVSDRFNATNEFHGGEIGLKGRVHRSCYWLEGMASMAIGANRRGVTVDGSTTSTVPSVGSSTAAGGLLTSEVTNIGYYSDSKTTVIPNFRLALGCQIAPRVSGHIGYNVIVWDDVVVAADHLPPGLAVDPRNLPPITTGGGTDPAFPGLQSSTMVAHGLDVGIEFTY